VGPDHGSIRISTPPSNRRLQLTAFGARDRGFFALVLLSAPRRQLKRKPFGCCYQRPFY